MNNLIRTMPLLCIIICIISHLFRGSFAVQFDLQPNEHFLFLGHSNTIQASVMPYGFINIFEEEANRIYANITVASGGFVRATNKLIMERVRNDEWIEGHSHPHKVVLTFGVEMLDTYHELVKLQQHSHKRAFSAMRFEIESIIAHLVGRRGYSVVIAPILLHGESVFEGSGLVNSQRMEKLIEECTGMFRQIARDYDNVMYIDLPSQIAKCLEKINPNNMHHSVLTFDGRALNEAGHEFIATSLLTALGADVNIPMQDGSTHHSRYGLIRGKEEEIRVMKEERMIAQQEARMHLESNIEISAAAA